MGLEDIEEFARRYNPRDFYSRLIDIGFEEEEASRWSQIYELGIYKNVTDAIRENFQTKPREDIFKKRGS